MASSIAIPELNFLSPQSTPRRCFSLSRNSRSRLFLSKNRGGDFRLRSRIRAAKEDGGVVVKERERKLIESGNGAAIANTSGNGYAVNGSVEGHSNGGVSVVESGNWASNGSLVKYLNGNGAAVAEVAAEVRDV